MKTISKKYLINSSIEKVWESLVTPRIIEKWSGSKAEMSDEENSNFKLWNGDIFGKNIKVVKNKELVQEWSEKNWDNPSEVNFSLVSKNNKTELVLIHKNVPDEKMESISSGWDEYYLGPLKNLVEGS